jgi:hypothetical protein
LPATAAGAAGWDASRVAVAGTTAVVADADPGQPHVLVRVPTGWHEPSSNAATFGPVQATAEPAGLVASSSGLLLAVHIDHPAQVLGQTTSEVEFMHSTDGTTWTAALTSEAFAGSAIEGLAARPAGYVAVGWKQAGGHERATVWASTNGLSWGPGMALDPRPAGASDIATGVCVDGAVIAVVGHVTEVSGNVAPRAWVSPDGAHWSVVAMGPPAPGGGSAALSICAWVPAGPAPSSRVDAFGSVTKGGINPTAAYWTGGRASQWTRQATSPFGSTFPFPVAAVASDGARWLAVGTGGSGLPTSGVGPGGQSGLWRSLDGGASWQRLDTSGVAWLGGGPTHIDRVAWFGSLPVVAGAVDGRLAVWIGTLSS